VVVSYVRALELRQCNPSGEMLWVLGGIGDRASYVGSTTWRTCTSVSAMEQERGCSIAGGCIYQDLYFVAALRLDPCSDLFHEQEQSPGFPHGDGDCLAPGSQKSERGLT
jgi:hypothetical protein